jgi:hypothetical protein
MYYIPYSTPKKVALCIIQEDPPLAVDTADEDGKTALFACFNTLLEVIDGVGG